MNFVQQRHLINSVQDFVSDYFEKYSNPSLIFHTIAHTRQVVEAAMEISLASGLSVEEIEAVLIAAWFHDIGYCHTYEDHETRSEQIATDFLLTKKLTIHQMDSVHRCINVTRIPQQPVSLIQKVICDADLYHFSRIDYPAYAQALRTELELNLNLCYQDREWNTINYELLKDHKYFTTYGQNVLQTRKEDNIEKLLQKIIQL